MSKRAKKVTEDSLIYNEAQGRGEVIIAAIFNDFLNKTYLQAF